MLLWKKKVYDIIQIILIFGSELKVLKNISAFNSMKLLPYCFRVAKSEGTEKVGELL
jgi:hypothetical protein